MDREVLISYSLCYYGNYQKILNAIREEESVPDRYVENAITILDDVYPDKLKDLKYPPFVLYYKGDINLLKTNMIAVVGSRDPCSYALEATRALIQANQDKTVVSGMAKGIDACSHFYASKTIGILGCGIDYVYPKCNKELFYKTEREGLLLSEYPFNVKPIAYHFPFRNRLIAALSDKVYIMQSDLKSGTMTTVNAALELGKDIRVLPYDIFHIRGRNNNNLIYEGAQPIRYEEIAF
ncbi:MAG: DNA-protecting protein DprA [Erysipelotrichaceae bacterium]|nr:DNA-protecting protein DprA [Erysipelotrichaceae bacterium]